jgi:hypothetical protein
MNDYVTVALARPGLLTVEEFITATKYPIDTFMIDRFWNTMNEDRLIYVDDALIGWMGYSGIPSNMKKNFKVLIDSCGEYHEYTNSQYKSYLESSVLQVCKTEIYPAVDTSNGKGKTKHILLTPKCMKTAMMRINTSRGEQVREYYFALENLFKVYVAYQSEYKTRESAEALAEKEKQLAARDDQLNRVRKHNVELLEYKLFLEKKQTLYIGATLEQARQGLFKVSKTINVRARTSQNNTNHPVGDEFVVLHTIACSNSLELERRVKHVLEAFRPKGREFYCIQYNKLIELVTLLELHLNEEEDTSNVVIIMQANARETMDVNYLEGVPMEKFAALPAPDPVPLLEAPQNNSGAPTADENPVDTPNTAQTPTADQIPAITSKPVENPQPTQIPVQTSVQIPTNPDTPTTPTKQKLDIPGHDLTEDEPLLLLERIILELAKIGSVKLAEITKRLKSLSTPGYKFKASFWREAIIHAGDRLGVKIIKKS